MQAQYGLVIDCSFLDTIEDPDLWYLDFIPDLEFRRRAKEIANGAKTLPGGEEEDVPNYDLSVFEALK